MNFDELNFLKRVGVFLQLHAYKNSSKYNDLIDKLFMQKENSLNRSKKSVYKKREEIKNLKCKYNDLD